jgi:ATP-dependent helicase YprA (DUF1998 family)
VHVFAVCPMHGCRSRHQLQTSGGVLAFPSSLGEASGSRQPAQAHTEAVRACAEEAPSLCCNVLLLACAQVSLRAIDPERFAIVNEAAGGEVMEEIEASKAFYEVYDGAVYMFQVRVNVFQERHKTRLFCKFKFAG